MFGCGRQTIIFVYPEPFSVSGRYRLNFAPQGRLATMLIITLGLYGAAK
ncbi:hypothetical protein CEV34_4367 [Brucella pseudogrignonensis]|uniref:Uncharacterized protein n=1 Tax=Brucella pseudogrignonensis TaxID=419475 RepID=A0A256G5X6_9HYPH|nr:hypothetical protein CEV34_4367 [Brucella pseudogrignonensis]